MADYKIFSSDSHVSEPPDLWTERMDKRLLFRAPRVMALQRGDKVEDFLIYEGFPPHPVSVGLAAAAGQGDKAAYRESGRGYNGALPGGWDPAARLKDQDIDGVEGEILHTTLGFRLFWLTDAALQRECFRVYNEWLSEFCSHDKQRLVGVALISLYDIDNACEDLKRAQALGLRGGMIGLSPPPGSPPYSSHIYDPFWATAQELEMPVVLHEITGGGESHLIIAYWDEHASLGTVINHHEAQRTLGMLVLSGVLERFPRLKVISAENHADWVPVFLNRLNKAFKNRPSSYETKLSMPPVDYFHRQIYVTYMNEPDAIENRHIIGVDNLAFATDYPHGASTYPNSQKVVERDFESVSEEERKKMIHDNILKAYGLTAVLA
ncbi:MAG: amidohydrolase family protein [Dehalococcoidia bacterium]